MCSSAAAAEQQLSVLFVYAVVLEGYTRFTASTDDVHATLRACHKWRTPNDLSIKSYFRHLMCKWLCTLAL